MARRRMITIGLLIALTAAGAATAETRYTVLRVANRAGVQTVTVQPNGVREIQFEFNDRGRGPKLNARIELNDAGLPISVQTSGNDYLKAPVTERFTLQDGVARWQNNAESGERRLSGPAFYVSLHSVPEELGLLANALLKAPGMRLPLLPEGEASVQRTGEVTLGTGADARRVVSYEVTGLGFAPETVWLDADNTFFAYVSSWTTFVREGWESSAQQLLAKQQEREAIRMRATARELTRTPTGPVAIVNANLFDADTGESRPGTTVVIEGNRIKAVGKDREVRVPAGAEKIDARGRALLPGLWDMHVHVMPGDGVLHLAAGVTSVRDLANEIDDLHDSTQRIETGEEIGPRIVASGFMDGRGPFTGPTRVFVDTEEEARAAIDNYAKLGYPAIKIYSSIKPELVPAIIRLAHEKGLRVGGHVPAFMTAQQFVEAGADEIHHINFVILNFFFDQVKDTRTPARIVGPAQYAATLNQDSAEVRSFVRLLRERKVIVDPTVSIFHRQFTHRPGEIGAAYAPIAHRLPPQIRRSLLTGGLPVPEGMDERYRASAEALLKMVKLLHDSGVTLVAGTDSLAGFTLHRELELYAQAGIPAKDVLRIATLDAARVMKRDRELGSVQPGKLADMILVAGDPAQRVGDIRNTELVVKDGKIFEPGALYRSIGVQAR